MKKIKSIFLIAFIINITSCMSIISCSNDDSSGDSMNPEVQSCDFSTLESTLTEDYSFDAAFSDFFSESSRWESQDADIMIVEGKGQLTANSDTATILEAWKLYKTQMPYNKSWEISTEVTVPLYWNSNGGNEAQVGVGIFAGRPVASGQSSKVYECNLATVNGGGRFVQAQLVANRLGDDPIDVQQTILSPSLETATLKIEFCTSNKTLSLFIDDTIVGIGRRIDSSGLDNWELGDNDLIDIGIMGFAENTVITSNQPTIDNVSIKIY